MNTSSKLLGSFLLVSTCSSAPALAQIQGPPNLVDMGKAPLLEKKNQPLLSLTQNLDKKGHKSVTVEFGKYVSEADAEKSSLKWQIGPGLQMKAKYKRVKFTLEF